MWWAGVQHGDFQIVTAKSIWDTLVRPALDYGSEIIQYSAKNLQALESEQCFAAALILGVSTKSTHAALRSEIGWHTMKSRFDEAKLRYWWKLVNMNGERLTKQIYNMDRKAVLNKRAWDRSWCSNIRRILLDYGFDYSFWLEEKCKDYSKTEWESLVSEMVNGNDEGVCFYEIKSKPKLRSFKMIKHEYGIEDFMKISGHKKGKTLCLALRNGNNDLRIEMGRRWNERPEERVCRCCESGLTEDEMHFVNGCECYTASTNNYKANVLTTLEKYQVISLFDENIPLRWFEFMVGDLSSLPSHYHLGGEKGGCALELFKLSLSYLEEIEALRCDYLELIGFDQKGLPLNQMQTEDTDSSSLGSIVYYTIFFGT